jgi:hypothetical protein
MRTDSPAKERLFPARLFWLGPLVFILTSLSLFLTKIEARNQSEQEKATMTNTTNEPSLDFQVPKVTETATFALG